MQMDTQECYRDEFPRISDTKLQASLHTLKIMQINLIGFQPMRLFVQNSFSHIRKFSFAQPNFLSIILNCMFRGILLFDELQLFCVILISSSLFMRKIQFPSNKATNTSDAQKPAR